MPALVSDQAMLARRLKQTVPLMSRARLDKGFLARDLLYAILSAAMSPYKLPSYL